MSLNFNLTDIEDCEDICFVDGADDNGVLHQVTSLLIKSTFVVGLGKLLEDNVDEWLYRAAVCRRLGIPWGYAVEENGDMVDFIPSDVEIQAHVGLRTNSGTITRDEWWQRQIAIIDERIEAAANKVTDDAAINEAVADGAGDDTPVSDAPVAREPYTGEPRADGGLTENGVETAGDNPVEVSSSVGIPYTDGEDTPDAGDANMADLDSEVEKAITTDKDIGDERVQFAGEADAEVKQGDVSST